MNGEIAQMIALACHANAYLRNGAIAPFFPENSGCNFCDRITFVALKRNFLGKYKATELSKTPDDWFRYLGDRNANALKLIYSHQNNPHLSDRMSAGFVGGGGKWTMAVALPSRRSEYWRAHWTVWDQNAPERRIWRVTYVLTENDRARQEEALPLADARAALMRRLEQIHAFSKRNNCDGFTECFERAIDTIQTGKRHGHHQDLSPPGLLSREAELILDACQSSSVFGGMGSWNDMFFNGAEQAEYERVSDELFDSLNRAILSSVNSTRLPPSQ